MRPNESSLLPYFVGGVAGIVTVAVGGTFNPPARGPHADRAMPRTRTGYAYYHFSGLKQIVDKAAAVK